MDEYSYLRFLDLLYELTCYLWHRMYRNQVAFVDRDFEKRSERLLATMMTCLHEIREPLWMKYQDSEIQSEVLNAINGCIEEVNERVKY